MKSARLAWIPLTLVVAGLAVMANRAEAQFPLSPALWGENISLTVGSTSTSFEGVEPNLPEPHTEMLSATGYEVTGSVGFGSAEPPVGTAQVTWNVTEGTRSLSLSSIVNIDFQVRVIETSPPPVAVTEVPVSLLATGEVSAEDVFGSRATSSFRFQAVGTAVLITANLDISGDSQASDSFTIDETPTIPVDGVVLVSMSASASMGNVSTVPGPVGTALGVIDPVIEIADATIPGTAASYRDHFAVEFSEGYDAQTPVQRVTFGELKRRFGRRP